MVGCGGVGDGCWYVWVDVSGGCDVRKMVVGVIAVSGVVCIFVGWARIVFQRLA